MALITSFCKYCKYMSKYNYTFCATVKFNSLMKHTDAKRVVD